MSFLVRIYRYDGSESTIATYPDLPTAQWHAASLNQATQSVQYRAEEYDPVKAESFWIDSKKVLDELLQKGRKP